MPLLDVSDILSAPDFADTFDVTRFTKDVDADGVTVKRDASVRGVSGVIQNASELTLQRLADGSMLASTIEIHTTFPLTSGVDGQGADEIAYQGATYTVTDVADWSRYGAGFYRAICQMKDLRPAR